MRIDVLTLFPSMFDGPMTESMLWKARDHGLLDLRLHDIRQWTTDKHRKADDIPYGGGGGMVMKAEPIVEAIESVLEGEANVPVILLTPTGRVLSHSIVTEFAKQPRMVMLCGHYEGIDDRVRQLAITDEISIGDYVLTGGELAAMVVIDAVVRHIPGVLGAEGGAEIESHADGILEGPHYTRPAVFRGLAVPDALQNGDHAKIMAWRRREGLRRTWYNRPDLLRRAKLSEDDQYLLATFADEDARQP